MLRDARCLTAYACSLLVLLSAACAGDRPLVERLEDGAWQPEAFRVASLGGQRSGATIPFVLRLEASPDRRLIVEGTVEINPQARLVGGRWAEEDGTTTRAGAVTSAALDFFGGQGGRPSLGGQLTLSAEGTAVYRINLPATTLSVGR